MPYTKQYWTDDDPTTPLSGVRLTHLEEGVDANSTSVTDLASRLTAAETALGGMSAGGLPPVGTPSGPRVLIYDPASHSLLWAPLDVIGL